MNLPNIMTPDGRRAWAFIAMVGGSITFTLFAAVGVYLVRDHPEFSFWLAVLAHAQVALVLLGLAALLVKRMMRIGRDGIEIEDKQREGEE